MEHGVQAAACVLVLVAIVAAEAHRLNAWVAHFEPLWYEPLRVQRHHVRLRRSLLQQRKQHNPIFLRFFAFDKNFILKIRPDSSIFHEDFTLETETLGNLKPELGHIYSGQLVGDPSSRVFGALHGGVFEGSIRTRQGIFYVERSRKLFGGRRPVPSFHSLMYSPDDVKVPARDNLLNGSHLCGLAGNVRSWMDAMLGGMDSQESSDEQRGDAAAATRRRLLSVRPGWPESEQQRGDNDTTRARGGGRERRVCNLEVNVDHLLHAHFLDDARGEGSRARERITALVAQHVARASDVFRAVDFGGVEDINDSQSCASGKTAHDNPFCAPVADIGYLLHLTSLSNHDEFCLSYTWTYRDFYGGVLGLAWVANADRNHGGVCEKARPSAVSVGGSTEVLRLSTNVGVLTFLNYNSFVAAAVSEMVFCHELGHSFGADVRVCLREAILEASARLNLFEVLVRHDAPPGRSCYGPCAPCGEDGNYIMFPSPTQGRKPNNGKFSHCSRESIGRILAPMVAGESPRENCLQGECDYRHDVFSYDINVAVAFLIAHHMLSQVNATCVD
ncbi:hypothetical protein HPB49_021710 [Dermacentor silvarum]|uniref:Uncharacterized protein n=1 Tax=Dermacentor silvarum TaxID=543639 RepID=A0ACB8CMX3_DERSI|nr:hypothetical protein HPB49_021710 [Dermacentor silvarum]